MDIQIEENIIDIIKNKNNIIEKKQEENIEYIIGIDLGTTNSCVGWWSDGQVHILPNEHGNRTTPSFVAFCGNERIVGENAKNFDAKEFNTNNRSIIYESKRFMGRTFMMKFFLLKQNHFLTETVFILVWDINSKMKPFKLDI